MKNRCAEGALACVGAVIGAGFASGREIISFFTRYGIHAWWLILVSAVAMMLLCVLVLRRAAASGATRWCGLYSCSAPRARAGAWLCATLLMAVTGGAMISASGHMVALLWASDWAYPVGAVGSMVLAWLMGRGSIRPLSVVSGALTVLFALVMLAVLSQDARPQAVSLLPAPGAGQLAWAGVRAVAYAAMNVTLAIGVVCKCARGTSRALCRLSATFGLVLVGLLFVSNYLYLKHPELFNEAFPIVRLMQLFGREGFVISVALLYLAVFTTLTAILYALRGAVEERVKSPRYMRLIALGLPLSISLVGFSGIVDGLYAPAGLLCLALVFWPLMRRNPLDKRKAIR